MPILSVIQKNKYDTNLDTDQVKALIKSEDVLRPTGFDLQPSMIASKGTMEYCFNAVSGILHVIDENDSYTKLVGQTTFGDGVTPLSDLTFAIRPSDGELDFSYYYKGELIVKTALEAYTHVNTTDKCMIVFNELGNLDIATTTYDAISEDCICALIKINVVENQKIIFANERHGYVMDSTTHQMMHETIGAEWAYGLEIKGLTNNGSTYSGVTEGAFYDEDIKTVVPLLSTANFAYREGVNGDWVFTESPDLNIAFKNGAAEVQYNLNILGTWSLESIGSDYMVMHFYVTNDGENRLIKVLGQNLYADRGEARERMFEESITLQEGELPTPEFIHIACCIIHNESVGQIEVGIDNEIWIDCRRKTAIPRY